MRRAPQWIAVLGLGAAWADAGEATAAPSCQVSPPQSATPRSALSSQTTASFDAANAAREAAEAVEADGRDGVAEDLARIVAGAEELEPAQARARLLIHVGRTYAVLAGNGSARASQSRLRAVEVLTRASEIAAEANEQRLHSYGVGYLGEIYEREGRFDEAAELTRRAIFAAQSADAHDALYRWRWQLGRIHRAAGERELALEDYRGAVAALGEIRAQLAVTGGGEVAFRREVEPIYLELLDLLLARASGTATPGEKQALLREVRDTLEDWRAAELQDYFRDPCLDERRKARPDEIPGAVVVYPIVLPDRTELVVSRSSTLESYVSPVDRETLVAEVRAFRRMLEKRTTRQYLRHAHTLYDWLIRPIEPALSPDTEALVFVPGGALRTIPFAALRDRESGTYLIERIPVAITPGLTLTEPQPIDRETARLLAAGISEPVQGYGALANVGREIDAVGAAFPSRTLMNADFSVARFEAELSERPFGIVHIASHGEFSPDVSQSFLLAYDGKVSMDRLAALVSATEFRDQQPLELLVLSACRTASGDDRSALGLAGVALRAGARSAIATLWSVNDQATTELMTEFYAQLESPALSRAEALRRAQVKLLRTRHYRHPIYWSAFLLISSWL